MKLKSAVFTGFVLCSLFVGFMAISRWPFGPTPTPPCEQHIKNSFVEQMYVALKSIQTELSTGYAFLKVISQNDYFGLQPLFMEMIPNLAMELDNQGLIREADNMFAAYEKLKADKIIELGLGYFNKTTGRIEHQQQTYDMVDRTDLTTRKKWFKQIHDSWGFAGIDRSIINLAAECPNDTSIKDFRRQYDDIIKKYAAILRTFN